jgi:hypothetical protein
MKKLDILIIVVSLFMAGSVFSQNKVVKNNPFSLSVDVMSRYVWRGSDFGNSPSIQPNIEYNKGNLTLGAWGAYATNSNYQEADLYITYDFSDLLSLTLTDYFFPSSTMGDNYFDYDHATTGHIFEMSVAIDATEKFPLNFLLATNFYGDDANKLHTNGTTNGIQYSTYAELGYTFKNADAFIGFNLTKPNKARGESGFYGDSLGVVNLGITVVKKIKISNSFTIPLSGSLIANPEAEKIFMVIGFSL